MGERSWAGMACTRTALTAAVVAASLAGTACQAGAAGSGMVGAAAMTTPPVATSPVATTGVAAPPDPGQQLIVRFKPGLASTTQLGLIAQAGMTLDRRTQLADTVVVNGSGTLLAQLAWFDQQSQVEWAERNTLVHANLAQSYGQTDPYWTQQWSLANLGGNGGVENADADVIEAWAVNKGGSATIGVVDSGVDGTHPDLAGQLVPGANFSPDHASSTDTSDGSGHGTHVTGTVVAAENAIGIVGAAPAAKVLPLRALDDAGSGTSANVASAFAYAGKAGLRIVNASLGSLSPSRAQRDAIAASPGTLFIVAAGNTGLDLDLGETTDYPCEYDLPNVLCVGATDRSDHPSSFSNHGAESVDLMAPGEQIVSTFRGGGYQYESGTSMAAPLVSAAAGLLAVSHPDWTAVQLKDRLMSSTDQPVSLRGSSVTQGRLNAARAVGLFAGPDGMAPGQVMGLTATPGLGRLDLSWQPAQSMDLAVYQVEQLRDGTWAEQQIADTTSASITGLTPGVPVTVRVRAIDRSGEEGEASTELTATPRSTAAPATSTNRSKNAAGAAAGAEGTSSASACSKKRTVLSDVKRKLSAGRLRGISFKLAAKCTVVVSAKPHRAASGDTAAASAGETIKLALPAGTHSVRFGKGSGNLKLRAGRWKLTIATPGGRTSLTVRIR